ncbi:MAG: holo-ACP synthase [Planctomycetota bacterium]|jgi:holo-[acyl-carrier protein] synthase
MGAVLIMKIIAHGIDLVDFERIEDAEMADADAQVRRIEKLAGRFAAKEAVMKLIGSGWRDGIAWTDIEVVNNSLGQPVVNISVNNSLGQPVVNISGRVKELADEKGIEQITLSITHTANFAIASAVALRVADQ